MKKKVILISSVLLTLIVVISTIFIVNKNSTNNEVVKKDKIINNNSFLTLMLEQSDGSYQESTSNTWPGEGYIFNKKPCIQGTRRIFFVFFRSISETIL